MELLYCLDFGIMWCESIRPFWALKQKGLCEKILGDTICHGLIARYDKIRSDITALTIYLMWPRSDPEIITRLPDLCMCR